MNAIQLTADQRPPMSRQATEFVERKGLGHPDTICDSVLEAVCVALARAYIDEAGHVLHFNVDKGLLVAGRTEPRLGGGRVLAPMRLYVGDRATTKFNAKAIPITDIVESTVNHWFESHFRYISPHVHLQVINELHPGAQELTGIFDRENLTANDTSVGVGYAPLSETEHLVLSAEHFLNSKSFKHDFPETGEDIKVMGVRVGRKLHLTVAIAFLDRFLWESETYFHRKVAIQQALDLHVRSKLHELDEVEIQINTLDDPSRGQDGLYLTVLGTSAENGDSGQVGRGNRANGLISLSRPMSLEAVSGKNPVSHVGKIYNLLAHTMAERIHGEMDAVEEAYVWLCSRIGGRIDEPWMTSVQLSLAPGATQSDVEGHVQDIVRRELSGVGPFTQQLIRGEVSVC